MGYIHSYWEELNGQDFKEDAKVLTEKQLAQRYQLSIGTVNIKLKKYGIKAKKEPRDPSIRGGKITRWAYISDMLDYTVTIRPKTHY